MNSLYTKTDPVQILDDGSFQWNPLTIKKHCRGGPGVLKVYSPGCPHCQDKVEPLKALAENLHEHGMQVYVLDATDNPDITGKLQITGYPTFLEVTAEGTIGEPLKDKDNEQVYTVPGIVISLCGNNQDICKYAKQLGKGK